MTDVGTSQPQEHPRLSASRVKEFAQYDCDRRLRYAMAGEAVLSACEIEAGEPTQDVWKDHGREFEALLVANLESESSVLMPAERSDGGICAVEGDHARRFLAREIQERFCHQLRLDPPRSFRERLGVPEEVVVSPAFLDLVEVVEEEPVPVFRVIEIKATGVATHFHRVQVAYYSILLEEMLRELRLPGRVAAEGVVRHQDPLCQVPYREVTFDLAPYQRLAAQIAGPVVARILKQALGPGLDQTFFHLYFKCEACPYLARCDAQSQASEDRARWDLSNVPGMSQGAKRFLQGLGVASLGELIAHAAADWPALRRNWTIRNQGRTLVERARAIVENRAFRLPGRSTHQAARNASVRAFLAVEDDPVSGRLTALGLRIERDDAAAFERIEVPRSDGALDEREVLTRVLGELGEALANVHEANRAGADLRVHLYVYEPLEAASLRRALGRHVAHDGFRTALLHLLRIFPPEQLLNPQDGQQAPLAEPGYARRDHLPGTSLRRAIEEVFALPIRVSYDLATVSACAGQSHDGFPSIADADVYRPAPSFRRPFSSRLPFEATRQVWQPTGVRREEVAQEVSRKLIATAALERWLQAIHAIGDEPLIRLDKAPFELCASFDPFGAADLDVLHALELLEDRAADLATRIALARPLEQRCEAGATLPVRLSGEPWLQRWRTWSSFVAGPEASETRIKPDEANLILSDGLPSTVLDDRLWDTLSVDLHELEEDDSGSHRGVLSLWTPKWSEATEGERPLVDVEGDLAIDSVYRNLTLDRVLALLEALAARADHPVAGRVMRLLRDPLGYAQQTAGEPEARRLARAWRMVRDDELIPALHAAERGDLTTDQLAAWDTASASAVCVVWGPPGTGKTWMLSVLLAALLRAGEREGTRVRIFVTAFTRRAIVNLVEAIDCALELVPCAAKILGLSFDASELAELSPRVHAVSTAKKQLGQARKQIEDLRLGVVACTVWQLHKVLFELDASAPLGEVFDLVCIDEASQMVVAQALLAFAGLAPGGRVIVAGDDRQLPPIRASRELEIGGRPLGGSIYSLFEACRVPLSMLSTTFRLNAPLACFPREAFYEGRYEAARPNVRLGLMAGWEAGLDPLERVALDPELPVVVIVHDLAASSVVNPFEARLAARLVDRLRARVDGDTFATHGCAIVSPHRAQNALIRALLREALGPGTLPVVDTVERIQGSERDAIVLSYCVSDPEFAQAESTFIFDPNRFNVAITRARHKLIVLVGRSLLDAVPTDEEALQGVERVRAYVDLCRPLAEFSVVDAEEGTVLVAVRALSFADTRSGTNGASPAGANVDGSSLPPGSAGGGGGRNPGGGGGSPGGDGDGANGDDGAAAMGQDDLLLEAVVTLSRENTEHFNTHLTAIGSRVGRFVRRDELRPLEEQGLIGSHWMSDTFEVFFPRLPAHDGRSRARLIYDTICEVAEANDRYHNAPIYEVGRFLRAFVPLWELELLKEQGCIEIRMVGNGFRVAVPCHPPDEGASAAPGALPSDGSSPPDGSLSEQDELLQTIIDLAGDSQYGNTPIGPVEARLARPVSRIELDALAERGLLRIETIPEQPGRYPAFEVLVPISAQEREELLAAIRDLSAEGDGSTRIPAVGQRLGRFVRRDQVVTLASLGLVRLEGRTGRFGAYEVIVPVEAGSAPESAPPVAGAEPVFGAGMVDDDWRVLSALEDRDAERIALGVFELWTRVETLVDELANRGIAVDTPRVEEALHRLDQARLILRLPSGETRSRIAEMCRTVRLLKQRFSATDAAQRPYLVRSVKLLIRDRYKPRRTESLIQLANDLAGRGDLGGPLQEHGRRVLAGLVAMAQACWKCEEPTLARFQASAFGPVLRGYFAEPATGVGALAIAADTGAGKTEAVFLPLVCAVAAEALAGVKGTKAVFVFPRRRLAYNQLERFVRYLHDLAAQDGFPRLRIGLQSADVLADLRGPHNEALERLWGEAGPDGSYAFPLFPCPACADDLRLHLGAGDPDLLRCVRPVCGFEYAGFVGTKSGLVACIPDLFLVITESLHHWLMDPEKAALFGLPERSCTPRAVVVDEYHLYSHVQGAQVALMLRRLLARLELGHEAEGRARDAFVVGMSATIGNPAGSLHELTGLTAEALQPEQEDCVRSVRGREHFVLVQPEVESRGARVAVASTTIQAVMALAHQMPRRPGHGYRGLVFFDSIDKLKRLHADFMDAEQRRRLFRYRTTNGTTKGQPCCDRAPSGPAFDDGECWWFAARDEDQWCAGGQHAPHQALRVMPFVVYSGVSERVDRLIRTSDLVFATSSLEVGFDDPDMIFVYQHGAPGNVASFVQRKGRGGRGLDDRPLTGATLSAWSARDAYYFAHPELLLDGRKFVVPLNPDNFFVQRGQALAATLDVLAHVRAIEDRSLPQASPARVGDLLQLAREHDGQIRRVLDRVAPDLLRHESFRSPVGLLRAAADSTSGGSAWSWANYLPWIPGALFEGINLPLVRVTYEDQGQVRKCDLDVDLASTECAPGNVTLRFGKGVAHVSAPRGLTTWIERQPEDEGESHELPGGLPAALRFAPRELRERLERADPAQEVYRPTLMYLQQAGSYQQGRFRSFYHWCERCECLFSIQDGPHDESDEHEGHATSPIEDDTRARPIAFHAISDDQAMARRRLLPAGLSPLMPALELYRGGATPGRTGLTVWRLLAGVELAIALPRGRRVHRSLLYRHEAAERPQLHGFKLETEGVCLRLDQTELEAFLDRFERDLVGAGRRRWFESQALRQGVRSCLVVRQRLDTFQAGPAADLFVAAADDSDFGPRLRAALGERRADVPATRAVLSEALAQYLDYHPTLQDREALLAGLVGAARELRELLQRTGDLRKHLRDHAVHSLTHLWRDAFVIHGRGEEGRVVEHCRLASVQGETEPVVRVFERGCFGDGTTRSFQAALSDAVADLLDPTFRACPHAEEDAFLERALGPKGPTAAIAAARADVASGARPADEAIADLAREVAGTSCVSRRPELVQALARVVIGRERIHGVSFDLLAVHREVRAVGAAVRARLGREPTALELVGAAVARAVGGDPMVPTLVELLQAYDGLNVGADAEPSLQPAERLADQVFRVSARLCVDGCLACVAAACDLDLGPEDVTSTVSRTVLAALRRDAASSITVRVDTAAAWTATRTRPPAGPCLLSVAPGLVALDDRVPTARDPVYDPFTGRVVVVIPPGLT